MYKMGDAELRLDVAKLNAFDAMQATMKEMGYDEGEEGDEEYEGQQQQQQQQQVLPLNVDPNRKYKMGDVELRLDVAKLNAFEAMQATMKEMGFDEGEEGEEEEEQEKDQQQAAQSSAAPTGGGGSGGKRAQVQPSEVSTKIEDVGTLMMVAKVATKFRPDAYRGVSLSSSPAFPPPYWIPPPPALRTHRTRGPLASAHACAPTVCCAELTGPSGPCPRQEPPDFEPPPFHKCFEEEEGGSSKKMQIAIVSVSAPHAPHPLPRPLQQPQPKLPSKRRASTPPQIVGSVLLGCVIGVSIVLSSAR